MTEHSESKNLWVGLGGARRNGCAALCTADKILGVCEQERITRVRSAGFNPSGLPDEAIDELLRRANRKRSDISKYVLAETAPAVAEQETVQLEHHFAHACSAFLPSPFESATAVICDHQVPQISVWEGNGNQVKRADWLWHGPGFAEIYSLCAEATGFSGDGREQKMEALARLDPDRHDDRVDRLFGLESDHLRLAADWQRQIETLRGTTQNERVALAASIQSRLGDLLVELITAILRDRPSKNLCLAGSLFFNSYINGRLKQAGIAQDVFIPVNPGNAGLAVGSVLHLRGLRQAVPPFLGPAYTNAEIKATLDNCKLKYELVPRSDAIATAVNDLKKGRLVGWFAGPMEWGPRSLGGRSILANPFSPYVLDNLNQFLKHREPWRGYALSGLEGAVQKHFDGPASSPFMECDYRPRDREMFRNILPSTNATVRVQTVGVGRSSPIFRELLEVFEKETGFPILVNTSFNGFREPIVCTARDAVRVFYGTGIDTLILADGFILRK